MDGILPLDRRPYDCFVSYAGEDAAAARAIVDWLGRAGLRVWFDQSRMGGGASVVDELTRRVCDSRALLLLGTGTSVAKPYVRHEVEIGTEQQVTTSGFRVLALRLDRGVDLAAHFPSVRKLSWVDAERGVLDLAAARSVLVGLTAGVPVRTDTRHVFVTHGRGEAEAEFTRRVCAPLARRGVRLVGDSLDGGPLGEDWRVRVRRIMSGCSGHLLVLPSRRSPGKTPEQTYKSFRAEWEIGQGLGLPRRVFCAARDVLPSDLAAEAVEVPTGPGDLAWEQEALSLHDEVQPSSPHVFLALEHRHGEARGEAARAVLEHVLGMTCALGRDFPGDDLRNGIVRTIRGAVLVVADLATRADATTGRIVPNLNTLAEAGIAVGAERPLYVLSFAPPGSDLAEGERTRQVPFMFRNAQIHWYADDVEFLARVHAIACGTRRRILDEGTAGRRS